MIIKILAVEESALICYIIVHSVEKICVACRIRDTSQTREIRISRVAGFFIDLDFTRLKVIEQSRKNKLCHIWPCWKNYFIEKQEILVALISQFYKQTKITLYQLGKSTRVVNSLKSIYESTVWTTLSQKL